MTEKQRLKPKNSSSLKFYASFDTLLDPRCAKVVEIEITSKIALFEMILRANTPVWDGGDLFWTDFASPSCLLQADATASPFLGGSCALMEIISPISAGRCQNGKIMSSSRATIHYLNCLVVGILKWNFQTKKRGNGILLQKLF